MRGEAFNWVRLAVLAAAMAAPADAAFGQMRREETPPRIEAPLEKQAPRIGAPPVRFARFCCCTVTGYLGWPVPVRMEMPDPAPLGKACACGIAAAYNPEYRGEVCE